MATYENNTLMSYKDANGDLQILYPITKAENVDGLSAEAVGGIPKEQLSATFNNVDVLDTALTLPRGLYYFSSSCSRLPSPRGFHILVSNRSIGESAKLIKTIAFAYDTSEIYINTFNGINNNDWSGWEILSSENLGGLSCYGNDKTKNSSTVLEVVNSMTTGGSFTAVLGDTFVSASDSPIPGVEFHYLVLVDSHGRKRVIAIGYADNDFAIFMRRVFNNAWLDSSWKSMSNVFLPLTGGTMSGNLNIRQGVMPSWKLYAGTSHTEMFKNANADGSVEDGTHWRDFPNSNVINTYDTLMLRASNDITNALRLMRYVNGSGATYKIYGEHNITKVKNLEIKFTNGKATYSNSVIKSTSLILAQRRSGAVNMGIGLTTHADNGVATFCAESSLNVTINLEVLIIN